MYSLEEIAALRQKCEDLKLEGREVLEQYSDGDLQKICNGIGPEAAGIFLRRVLNKLHPSLEVAALIHDVDFAESDGSEEKFTAANRRFVENGLKAAAVYPWYDLRRYIVRFHARRLGAFCQHFGTFCWRLGALREKHTEA
jgi:hypothetical protein